jgi:hypothetical protein
MIEISGSPQRRRSQQASFERIWAELNTMRLQAIQALWA